MIPVLGFFILTGWSARHVLGTEDAGSQLSKIRPSTLKTHLLAGVGPGLVSLAFTAVTLYLLKLGSAPGCDDAIQRENLAPVFEEHLGVAILFVFAAFLVLHVFEMHFTLSAEQRALARRPLVRRLSLIDWFACPGWMWPLYLVSTLVSPLWLWLVVEISPLLLAPALTAQVMMRTALRRLVGTALVARANSSTSSVHVAPAQPQRYVEPQPARFELTHIVAAIALVLAVISATLVRASPCTPPSPTSEVTYSPSNHELVFGNPDGSISRLAPPWPSPETLDLAVCLRCDATAPRLLGQRSWTCSSDACAFPLDGFTRVIDDLSVHSYPYPLRWRCVRTRPRHETRYAVCSAALDTSLIDSRSLVLDGDIRIISYRYARDGARDDESSLLSLFHYNATKTISNLAIYSGGHWRVEPLDARLSALSAIAERGASIFACYPEGYVEIPRDLSGQLINTVMPYSVEVARPKLTFPIVLASLGIVISALVALSRMHASRTREQSPRVARLLAHLLVALLILLATLSDYILYKLHELLFL
jgi:hypothetical protein